MIHVESRPRCSAGYECRQCDEAIGPIPSAATPGKNQVNGEKDIAHFNANLSILSGSALKRTHSFNHDAYRMSGLSSVFVYVD